MLGGMKSFGLQAMTLLLGLMLLAPLAGAHEEEHEWEDDDRTLEVEEDETGVEIRSDRDDELGDDRVRLRLDGDAIEFDFQLQEGEEPREVESELEVELERILEFEDENGDGAFQNSDDVRESYDKNDLTLENITISNVSSGGVDGVQVSARYAFLAFPGSYLEFQVTAFGNLTSFQGVLQRPVELKMDIIFEAFPYTEATTLPAVELDVKTEAPEETNLTGDQVAFTTGNLTAVFSWLRTATVDGVDQRVGVTVGPAETEIEDGQVETVHPVVFAYARGDNIVHDPTFGFVRSVVPISETLSILGNTLFFAIGIAAAVIVFAVLAFARRKRKA